VPGCQVVVPHGLASVDKGIALLTSGKRTAPRAVRALSSGELQTALQKVSTLIAPTSGVSGSMLARYTRDVHVVNSGASDWPSIVVIFDDPQPLADSITPIGQRPRHLIVILDKGMYGYRPTYTYSTVANRRAPPRYAFLDYLDVDDDGKAEIFLGWRNPPTPLAAMYTLVLHFENDAWRERLRYDGWQCQG
jgi:hypothetical protein